MTPTFGSLLESAGFAPETAQQIAAARSGNFEQLVGEIGYPAADAASQLSSIERNYNLGKAELEAAGEEERRQIDVSMEDRGILRSGHRNQEQARQQERQARSLARLDAAAADDIAGIDRAVGRAAHEMRANQWLAEQNRMLQNEQLQRALSIARQDASQMIGGLW